jgi:hypothetical protein
VSEGVAVDGREESPHDGERHRQDDTGHPADDTQHDPREAYAEEPEERPVGKRAGSKRAIREEASRAS